MLGGPPVGLLEDWRSRLQSAALICSRWGTLRLLDGWLYPLLDDKWSSRIRSFGILLALGSSSRLQAGLAGRDLLVRM